MSRQYQDLQHIKTSPTFAPLLLSFERALDVVSAIESLVALNDAFDAFGVKIRTPQVGVLSTKFLEFTPSHAASYLAEIDAQIYRLEDTYTNNGLYHLAHQAVVAHHTSWLNLLSRHAPKACCTALLMQVSALSELLDDNSLPKDDITQMGRFFVSQVVENNPDIKGAPTQRLLQGLYMLHDKHPDIFTGVMTVEALSVFDAYATDKGSIYQKIVSGMKRTCLSLHTQPATTAPRRPNL